MKKIRLGLMALAAVAGLSSTYAANHRKPVTGTLYYAKMINSTQAKWTKVKPSASCDSDSHLACTITSTSANVTALAPDTFPAQFSIVSGNGLARN